MQKAFAVAFAEWQRRWREDPTPAVENETPEAYGDASAAYFVTLLDELAQGKPWETIGQEV